jgi:hypothetical protein
MCGVVESTQLRSGEFRGQILVVRRRRQLVVLANERKHRHVDSGHPAPDIEAVTGQEIPLGDQLSDPAHRRYRPRTGPRIGVGIERLRACQRADVLGLAVAAQLKRGCGVARPTRCILWRPDTVCATAPVDVQHCRAVTAGPSEPIRRLPAVVGDRFHTRAWDKGTLRASDWST